jgi:hypothetical protein
MLGSWVDDDNLRINRSSFDRLHHKGDLRTDERENPYPPKRKKTSRPKTAGFFHFESSLTQTEIAPA